MPKPAKRPPALGCPPRPVRRHAFTAAASLLGGLLAGGGIALGVDWSNAAYQASAEAIATLGFSPMTGLPQAGAVSLAVPVPDPTTGKIRMQYNFGWSDPAFGINAADPLLAGQRVGDAADNLYLVKAAASLPGTVTLPRSTPGYNQGAIPWLCVDGTRLAYLQARSDQWDASLAPTDPSPLNPWRRNAAIVGMNYDVEQGATPGGYANNYIVTFDIEPKYVFRPNRIGIPSDAAAESPPMVLAGSTGTYEIDPQWTEAWRPGPTPVIYNAAGTAINATFSDFLISQWNDNTLTNAFPWTGIGYTYDWYYQDPARWSLGEGVGLAEFLAMPSTETYEVVVDIVSVQTTAQLLGQTEQFPGVPVPEPATLWLAVLASGGLIALARRRQAGPAARASARLGGG